MPSTTVDGKPVDPSLARESEAVKVKMAGSKYWTIVRRIRGQLAERFRKDWNPNEPISEFEDWIYITALEDGENTIDGAGKVATRTFECSPEQGACAIARQTHRVSTDREIEKFKTDRLKREEYCREANERLHPELAVNRASLRSTEALTSAAEAINALASSGGGRGNKADDGNGKGANTK
jgi:hypothetical protein